MLCCESQRPAPRSLLNMSCRGVVVMFFHVSGGPSSFSKIYFLNCLLHLLKLRRHMPTSNMISTLTARMPRPRASFSEIPTSCRLCWHTNLSRSRWRRLVLERPRAKLDVCSGKELAELLLSLGKPKTSRKSAKNSLLKGLLSAGLKLHDIIVFSLCQFDYIRFVMICVSP